MGWKVEALLLVFVIVPAAYFLDGLIKYGQFAVVHNHLPGNCTKFEMPGSEDMVLYPNHHVLISSGIFLYDDMDISKKPPAGIFLMDLNEAHPKPIRLPLQDFPQNADNFGPHGMAGWVRDDGSHLLYVVSHRKEEDVVELFEYFPSKLALVHRKTIRDPLFRNLNNLVIVGEDEFYVTVDRYFTNKVLKILETFSLIPWPLAPVLYYHNGKTMIASEGLRYPNGIEKSRDGRFIFVNEIMRAKLVAFTRNHDNTLHRVQEIDIQPANDNLFVDPETGHLWVGVLVNALKVGFYFHDHSVPVASKILHIKLDQSTELPFENVAVEEVFSSSVEDGVVGAVTVGLYARKRLLVGTICKDMMLCEVNYVMYK